MTSTCPIAAEPRVAAGAEPTILVVVPTWRSVEVIDECLASVVPQLGSGDRLLVVDNASRDGTVEKVRRYGPAVELVVQLRNLGFAGAANVGLQRGLELGVDWVWLLNPDTAVPAGGLAELRRCAAGARGVGALQPLLVSADGTRIDSCGHRVGRWPAATEAGHGAALDEAPAVEREVFGACGAAALIATRAVRAVGLLDESLFVLLEDVDFMFRLRAGGFAVRLVPSVRVRHRGGVSRAPTAEGVRQRKFWVQRNTIALALRWWPAAALLTALPVLAWRAAQATWLGRRHGCGQSLPLWRSALAGRARHRAAMRAHGVDSWLGRDPLS